MWTNPGGRGQNESGISGLGGVGGVSAISDRCLERFVKSKGADSDMRVRAHSRICVIGLRLG